MKALLFSDLHLDMVFANAVSREGARRRRQTIRDTLARIIDVALDEKVDVVLCGGDVYEQDRVTPDTAALLQAQFERLSPIPLLIAPGNHDWFGPGSVYARNRWSGNVHIFTQPHLEPYALLDGMTIWGAAHDRPAGTESFLDSFSVDRGGVNIGLFHGSEWNWLAAQGEGKQPHAPFRTEQVAESGLQHVLLGHYHTPKHDEWFTYPGNPTPLSFGEDGDHGAVIVEIDESGNLQRRVVPVAVGQACDISLDLTGVTNATSIRDRARDALADKAGSVRLRLSGEIPMDAEFRTSDLRELGEHLDTLVIESANIRVALKIDDYVNDPTVRGEFVQLVRDSDLSPQDKEKVIITGLRALEERDDLAVE